MPFARMSRTLPAPRTAPHLPASWSPRDSSGSATMASPRRRNREPIFWLRRSISRRKTDPVGRRSPASPLPERKEVLCAPASPTFDERGLEELAETTQTDPDEWGYPLRDGVEARETPNATAPVIEKLGMHFVRVLQDDSQSTANTSGEWLRIVAPSGNVGFVPADALTSPASNQLCYTKEGNAWKIAGLVGGGE